MAELIDTVGITKRGASIYNEVGLLQKFEDICMPASYPWVESLQVTASLPLPAFQVEDDLKRESEFYKSTLDGVKWALQKFDTLKIPYMRPDDFLAEMIKTDSHMSKVKSRLLTEKSRMEAVAARKKQAEAKRYMKETRSNVIKQRQADKKQSLDEIKRWKKDRKNGQEGDIESSLGKRSNEARTPAKSGKREKFEPNPKRQRKNEKFGSGGRKRGLKNNTAESAADTSSFSGYNRKPVNKSKPSFGNNKGNNKGNKKSFSRPGNKQRHQNRK